MVCFKTSIIYPSAVATDSAIALVEDEMYFFDSIICGCPFCRVKRFNSLDEMYFFDSEKSAVDAELEAGFNSLDEMYFFDSPPPPVQPLPNIMFQFSR
jgi:hypothetical protein